MEAGVVVILIGGAAAAVILWFFSSDKRDSRYLRNEGGRHDSPETKREDIPRQEDELIYVHGRGRVTVEQAEAGVEINKGSILSYEDIRANYSEEEQQIQLINRDLLLSGIEETDDGLVAEFIDRSEMSKQYKAFDISYLWQLKEEVFIGVICLAYGFRNGKREELAFEYQLIVVVTPKIHSWLKIPGEVMSEVLDDSKVLMKISRKASYEDFKKLKQLLSK
jgi:hypothetical protein